MKKIVGQVERDLQKQSSKYIRIESVQVVMRMMTLMVSVSFLIRFYEVWLIIGRRS